MRCPKCGKFLKSVKAYINTFNESIKVEGRCYSHGKVAPTDWIYEDFFPPKEVEEGEN